MNNLTPSQRMILRMIASRSKTNGYTPMENGAFFEDRLGADYVKTHTPEAKQSFCKLQEAGFIEWQGNMILATAAGRQKAKEIIKEGLRTTKKPTRRPYTKPKSSIESKTQNP